MPLAHRLALLASLLIITALVGSGCGQEASSTPEEDVPSRLPVQVAAVERGRATAALSSTASLTAVDEATVVAQVEGVVEEILIEEGQYVQTDQTLARLDDQRLALEVRQAEVALAERERAFNRTKTLYEKQLVSRETFEQARTEYETQQVARDLAQLNLTYATIRAPISGWVSVRHIKTGNMVRTHDPTFEITTLNPLHAELHVPERNLSKLRVGQSTTLQFDALPDRPFEGHISLISPVVDPETGTFKVTVEVRDGSRTIKPGMFSRVRVQYDRREDALLVPRSAIVEEDGSVTVFVVEDSIALQRRVATGYSNGDRVEIVEGLDEGDLVVLSGQTALRDSSRVEVIEPASPA